MSRNYVGAIGPLSEPVLIFEVIAGSPISNITVLWLDPMQTLVDVGDISLAESSGVSRSYFSVSLSKTTDFTTFQKKENRIRCTGVLMLEKLFHVSSFSFLIQILLKILR